MYRRAGIDFRRFMSQVQIMGVDQRLATQNPIRVLVVDDHPVVRRAVSSTLQQHPRFEVCAEAENGAQAVDGTDSTTDFRAAPTRQYVQRTNLLAIERSRSSAINFSRACARPRAFRRCQAGFLCSPDCVAEREGFEPPVRFSKKNFEIAANKRDLCSQNGRGEQSPFIAVSLSLGAQSSRTLVWTWSIGMERYSA